MILNKYRCDVCGSESDNGNDFVGVALSQSLFVKDSHPFIFDATAAKVHVCMDCVSVRVSEPQRLRVRSKRAEYLLKIESEEVSFLLRKQAIQNFMTRKLGK